MKSQYLPKEDYKPLLRRMQPSNALAMKVMLHTGLRIDDVLSLRKENLVGNKVFFVAKKTGKEGSATLTRSLTTALLKNSNKEWLFPSPYKGGKKHISRQAVFIDLKKAVQLIGQRTHISPHSTRKTFAVEVRKKSGIDKVQEALQHSDLSTTLLYALSDIDSNFRSEPINIDPEILAGMIAEKVAAILLPEIKKLFVDYKSTYGSQI